VPASRAGHPAPAVSIGDLERAAAGGWRAPEEIPLGGWLLRAAGGFTGRANSALAVGDPGLPLPAAVAQVRRWYRTRGLPPMVSVSFPLSRPHASAVDRFLAGQGWRADRGAIVMAAVAEAVAETAAGRVAGAGAGPRGLAGGGVPAGVRVEVHTEPDDGWLELYRFRGERPPPISRRLLMSAPWQAFGRVREAGRTLAIGRVAEADGWAGLTAVAVDPRHRRRGLGGAITGALAAAAAARGVTRLYLQVETGNAAARSLYRRAGFTDHHEYHYRIAPPEAAPEA